MNQIFSPTPSWHVSDQWYHGETTAWVSVPPQPPLSAHTPVLFYPGLKIPVQAYFPSGQ